jgi:hypothetical protein
MLGYESFIIIFYELPSIRADFLDFNGDILLWLCACFSVGLLKPFEECAGSFIFLM